MLRYAAENCISTAAEMPPTQQHQYHGPDPLPPAIWATGALTSLPPPHSSVGRPRLAELYRKSDVNPLLAIFPAFAQIPIFIGLYRALVNLGKVNLLDEPFLWLPSLEGLPLPLPLVADRLTHPTPWLPVNAFPQII